MRGLFCIDPGQSTGIAWGIVDDKTRVKTAIETVRTRLHSGSTTITGTEPEQIRELYSFWTQFKKGCVQKYQLDPTWIDLVVEDFVLFPGEKPGKSTTVSERISWGFEGYRLACLDNYRKSWPKHYTPITWQKSGAASRFSKRDILTKASAWVVGKDHERSAYAHMILRTNVLLDNQRR